MPTPDPDGQVNTSDFNSLADAVAAVPNNGTVVLAADTSAQTVIADGKNVTIDLNGKTLTAEGASALEVTNGSVTLTNGTVAVSGADAIKLDTRVSGGQVELNVGEDVVLTSDTDCCIYVAGNAVVNVAGKLTVDGTYCAIQGNGNANSAGTIVNITGGTISAKDIAVYLPQDGEVNISGGTITGTSAVYCKSGKLNITGGTFVGNGEKADYVFSGNGCSSTGDALVVDNCNYPGGSPEVSISGGTFTSVNAEAVGSYANGEMPILNNFIVGGTFSSDISALCTEGYKAIQNGSKWTVVKSA